MEGMQLAFHGSRRPKSQGFNHYPILPVGMMSDLQLSVHSDDQEARVFPGVKQTWFDSAIFQIYGGEHQLGAGRKTDSERGIDLPKATQQVRGGLGSRTQVLCEFLPLSCPLHPGAHATL